MFTPGWSQMLIVLFIALLLFGKRLPEVAKNLGKGLREFQAGMKGIQNEVNTAARSAADTYNSAGTSTKASRPIPEEEQQDDDFDVPKFELPTSAPVEVTAQPESSDKPAESNA